MMRLFRSGIIAICSLNAFDCVAAELLIKPWVETRAAYDTNPRLRLQSDQDVAVTINEVGAQIEYERPTYSLRLRPRARFSNYTEETELDSKDYFLNLNGQKLFERHQLSLTFDYEREASITTEVIDSGLFNINLPRTTLAASVAWTYLATEKLTNTAFFSASKISFERDPASPFVDYSVFGVGNNIRYATTENTTLLANFNVSEFRAPSLSLVTRSHSFQIGAEHQLYHDLSMSLLVGRNIGNTEFKTPQTTLISLVPLILQNDLVDGEENANGDLISFGATKTYARGLISLNWDRSFSPASQGIRRETQDVNALGRYLFSERITSELRVFYRESTQEGELTTRLLDDLNVLTISARSFWQFAKKWRIEGGFRYREQTRVTQDTAADAYRLYFALRFSPQEMAFKLNRY